RVPAALEVGRQPDAHHAVDQLLAEQVRRQTKDIRVVVPPTHLGGDAVVTGRGANVLDLVGGDAHADAGAADQDAAVHATFTHGGRDLKRQVGVVHAFG